MNATEYLSAMPKPPKRPRDMMQLAKLVGELATGEATEPETPAADPAAVKRGEARRDSLSKKRRKAIAKKAASARWKKG